MFTQCVVCVVSVAITLQGKTLMLNVEYKVQKEVCECNCTLYDLAHNTVLDALCKVCKFISDTVIVSGAM